MQNDQKPTRKTPWSKPPGTPQGTYQERGTIDQLPKTIELVRKSLSSAYRGKVFEEHELRNLAQMVLIDLCCSRDPKARAIAAGELLRMEEFHYEQARRRVDARMKAKNHEPGKTQAQADADDFLARINGAFIDD